MKGSEALSLAWLPVSFAEAKAISGAIQGLEQDTRLVLEEARW